MRPHAVTLPTDQLQIGMFVADLDQPWLNTPFPLEGVFIDDARQIVELQSRCNTVVIDCGRSTVESLRSISHQWANAGSSSAQIGLVVTHVKRQARHWWGEILGIFRQVRATPAPPPRVAGIPDYIQLVAYQDTKPFDQAIGEASHAYEEIQATVDAVMVGLSEKREIAVESLRAAAMEMVDSVAANPEAMLWLTRMRERNMRTFEHSIEVAVYLVTFGRHLGFPREHLERFCLVGLLLDIGMTRIDSAVLDKRGKLLPAELAEVRRHVAYGLDILAGLPSVDADVRDAIAQHHERWDGSGYPRGLIGEEAGFAGRMAGIADTFAALTRERPHAQPLSAFHAMKVILGGAGTAFPEAMVEQFVQAIGLFPVGSLVELSTGHVAAVVSHNKIRRLKPRVLVLASPDKEVLEMPYEINLFRDPKAIDGTPIRILRGLPAGAYGIRSADYFLA